MSNQSANDSKRKHDATSPGRKLELRRQSLRKLTQEELRMAAGGAGEPAPTRSPDKVGE
jgi:hypothetical protein